MKKLVTLLMVFVMGFALCGCEIDKQTVINKHNSFMENVDAEEQIFDKEFYETSNAEETEKENIELKDTDEVSPTVYRTKTGKKYHTDGCIHLKSIIETTVEEARNMGIKPCSVCCPPQ